LTLKVILKVKLILKQKEKFLKYVRGGEGMKIVSLKTIEIKYIKMINI